MSLAIGTESPPLRVEPDGTVRIGPTRVTLDTLMASFDQGASPEQIVQQYPTLALADVYAVIGYCLRHKTDVDDYLRRRRQQAEQVRAAWTQGQSAQGIRERLLARRQSERGG